MAYACAGRVTKLNENLLSDLLSYLIGKPQLTVVRLLRFKLAFTFRKTHKLRIMPKLIKLLIFYEQKPQVYLLGNIYVRLITGCLLNLVRKSLQNSLNLS